MRTNRNHSLLIVDDEKSIRSLLSEILIDQGYRCEAVDNANKALERLKESTFDIILLDIRMPGMSGLNLLPIIRGTCNQISIIMVTAVNDANVAIEAMKKGASDYIVKPFRVEEVGTRIAAVIKQRESLNGGNKHLA